MDDDPLYRTPSEQRAYLAERRRRIRTSLPPDERQVIQEAMPRCPECGCVLELAYSRHNVAWFAWHRGWDGGWREMSPVDRQRLKCSHYVLPFSYCDDPAEVPAAVRAQFGLEPPSPSERPASAGPPPPPPSPPPSLAALQPFTSGRQGSLF